MTKSIKFMDALAKTFLFFFLLSSTVRADWLVHNVYVRDVEQFNLGGNSITRVIYESTSDSYGNVGCSANNTVIPGHPSRYAAAYWHSSINQLHQILVSQLLSAQAQEKPIDIFFESSGCNLNAAYGHGGLGRKVLGLRVRSD